jgi:selenocysteine lyase/cysteine desulfurase
MTAQSMIYLDNAATSFPKAPGIGEAMSQFVADSAANPGRAGHRMSVAVEQIVDDLRLRLTRMINGADHHRMVFAMNCTDALNMAIKGVLEGQLGGDTRPHVITTVLEHNSVSRPLQALASSGQIDLSRIEADAAGFVDPNQIEAAITDRTSLIAMTHASNVLGTIQDVTSVGQVARKHGLLFLVDAAQTMGVVPIDVEAMHIDMLAFPGHKSLLGPTGIGGLYVGSRVPEPAEAEATAPESDAMGHVLNRSGKLSPWREGGTGGDSSQPTQPALYPYYLEGGTPNTVGITGLRAAMQYLDEHDPAEHLNHERQLVSKLIDRFADDERFTVHGPKEASQCVSTVSLSVADFEPSDLGTILDDSFNIAVRPGLHCSPYTHRHLGTYPSGTLRISPGPFNTAEQIDQLIDALDQIAV